MVRTLPATSLGANMTKPTILALQHVRVETPGLVQAGVEDSGGAIEVVPVFEGAPVPADLAGHQGLVIMGGPMSVYDADNHPFLHDEARLIERALRDRVPVLGICLGSQLLASVLGARVYPGAHKEIGWYPVTLEDAGRADPLLGPLPPTFTPLHWHGDLFELPAGAEGLARSALTRHQGFVYDHNAYGLLFHLEMTAGQLDQMVAAFAGELETAGVAPHSLLDGARVNGATAETLGRELFARWAALVSQQAQAR
jgi:GMP synthase (glutamine-hydrolysing)